MAITREEPIARGKTADEDEDDLYTPLTQAPKATKRETLLQRKREKAGLGLMQVLAFGAGMLGRLKILPVMPEDIAAVHFHARPIAKSLADAAAEDDRFAAVFDRLTELGPYGAIIEAVTPLIVQIIANRQPAMAEKMGAIPPDVLMALVTGQDGPEYGTEPDSASMNGNGATR